MFLILFALNVVFVSTKPINYSSPEDRKNTAQYTVPSTTDDCRSKAGGQTVTKNNTPDHNGHEDASCSGNTADNGYYDYNDDNYCDNDSHLQTATASTVSASPPPVTHADLTSKFIPKKPSLRPKITCPGDALAVCDDDPPTTTPLSRTRRTRPPRRTKPTFCHDRDSPTTTAGYTRPTPTTTPGCTRPTPRTYSADHDVATIGHKSRLPSTTSRTTEVVQPQPSSCSNTATDPFTGCPSDVIIQWNRPAWPFHIRRPTTTPQPNNSDDSCAFGVTSDGPLSTECKNRLGQGRV